MTGQAYIASTACGACPDNDGHRVRVIAEVSGPQGMVFLQLALRQWRADHAGHPGVIVGVVPKGTPG